MAIKHERLHVKNLIRYCLPTGFGIKKKDWQIKRTGIMKCYRGCGVEADLCRQYHQDPYFFGLWVGLLRKASAGSQGGREWDQVGIFIFLNLFPARSYRLVASLSRGPQPLWRVLRTAVFLCFGYYLLAHSPLGQGMVMTCCYCCFQGIALFVVVFPKLCPNLYKWPFIKLITRRKYIVCDVKMRLLTFFFWIIICFLGLS